MSGVITAVLNATFGLLVNKARDYTAQKLKEGDLTDEQCRKLIVRELDDMKSKLDGLARKDLLSSVSFLEEGVCLLNMSLDKSSHDETRQDLGQAEAVIDEALPLALALSHEIRRLNISSEKRFQSAKASFEKSNTEATRAFNNEALTTDDRIFATKLRIISRILESFEDPDAAASACQLYLQALHNMPAIRELFSVHASGAGMKSLFKKSTRLENVKSVTMINYILFHFLEKFTKTQCPGVFNWPGIDIDKRRYYPLYDGSELLANMGVESLCHAVTCDVEVSEAISVSAAAVNSKREIIIKSKLGNFKVFNSLGEIELFCSLPQEETEARGFVIHSLAIDDEDNVYTVTGFEQTDNVYSFKLFVFDAEGNLKHQFPLEFLSGEKGWVRIAINMVKNIIIYKAGESRVHVCNNSGQLQCIFPLKKNIGLVYLSISDKNEIVLAPELTNTVYIYTEEGELERTIELPKDHKVVRVAFNYITKKVIVAIRVGYSQTFQLLSCSETGELQTLLCDVIYGQPTSHPSGPVAFVHYGKVLYLI